MPVTPEEYTELKESFEYNDSNGDGKVDFGEFMSMLEDLEADIDETEGRIGFRAIDTDNDGVIGLEEFIEWWSE